MTTIDNKINKIVDYAPKTKIDIEDKKRVVSILNKVRNAFHNYYLDPDSTVELHK